MNFKRANNITGWLVCLFACTVYILTTEAGGSLWDCGEFVSSCFKVQIPHPPGAPLFILLGRIAIIFSGNNPLTAAKSVNILNALAGGFTILFLFWTITHFARRIVHTDKTKEITQTQTISILAAGLVGALAFTFCDSSWYSAVEGEVYAMSGFFTAIVFWCILKWESVADEPGADRWIVLIFFLIGLSIGVHLLCLLTTPALVMVYYFRRRPKFNYALIRKYFLWAVIIGGAIGCIGAWAMAESNVDGDKGIPFDGTMGGLVIFGAAITLGILFLLEKYVPKEKKEYYVGAYMFFFIGVALEGVVQIVVIQDSIKYAGNFDIFFKNSLNMPYFTGFTVFFILLAVAIWFGLRFANRKGWEYLRLFLWSFAFMLIGYSTYLTTMIRSNADPAIDMYNVDNPMSLVGYLGRQQYGDWPIIYGQKFTAEPIQGAEQTLYGYEKTSHGYIKVPNGVNYVYNPSDMTVFPRMWDASNDQNHADYYAMFAGIQKGKDGTYDHAPTFGDNMKFFVSYQTYFMFFRYFMWNFSGKQNDIEGLFTGNTDNGNWITGIPFIDNAMYGDQSLLPTTIKENKAHNAMYALPFILGIIGLFYHFKKKGDDALVAFLLFLFTGFAIIIYLNQAGFQPRERDYAYTGCFYAFTIWIGLAVLYFIDMATKWDKKLVVNSIVVPCAIISLFFLVIGSMMGAGMAVGIGFAALFAIVAVGLPYILKYVPGAKGIAVAAALICLCVPALMGQQEWDDHDRHNKQLARDVAKDYLESCAPNAILFTFGDNDTYPLWYAQEVEGIRPDIRVINTSLLGIDWYINQFRYKINESAPIDVIWTPEQIEGGKRDAVLYMPKPNIPEDRYYNLYDMMKNYAGSDDPAKMYDNGNNSYNTFPVRKVSVPVDVNLVRANGTVNANDSVVSALNFELPNRQAIYKGDLAMLNIIAANNWKRPIYFTMPYRDLGFGGYLRRDGMSYRLVPVANSEVNTNWMYDVVMNKFGFANAQIPGVYYDEENRRHLLDIRQADATLALDLCDKGRKDDARKVLEKTDKMMLQQNLPYGLLSRGNDHDRISMMFLEACYRADDTTLASKVLHSVKTDFAQQMNYYNSLTGTMADNMQDDKQNCQQLQQYLDQMVQSFATPKAMVPEAGSQLLNAAPDTSKAKKQK